MNKLIIDVLVLAILSILSGILYRMGGKGKPYNTKYRDLGCAICAILILLVINNDYQWKILLSYFVSFGLYFGSLTTYWKGKAIDCKWYHWLFTGLGYGLAFAPFAFVTGKWVGFTIRTLIVGFVCMLWSQTVEDVVKEEFGRGFISTVTLPLLLI